MSIVLLIYTALGAAVLRRDSLIYADFDGGVSG